MAHSLQITNPLTGKPRVITIQNPLESAIKRRHEEKLSWYHRDPEKDTVAKHLGLDYPKLDAIRRSPELSEVVDDYIDGSPNLENSEEVRTHLGVKPAEAKTRGGGRSQKLTKSAELEIGQNFIGFIRALTEPLANEENYLSKDYIDDVINSGNLQYNGDLPPLPQRPVTKSSSVSKTAMLQAQVDELKAQLDAMRQKHGESGEEASESSTLFS